MFTISSAAFANEGAIPRRYTCDGANLSPPLAWADPPSGTSSFALLVDDPDAPDPAAPQRVWVHWIRYNLPSQLRALQEGAGNEPGPAPIRDARTDADKTGYHGPCPPIGRHRYFFRLYALDAALPDLGANARRQEFDAAIEGHVLASAVLLGTYVRGRRSTS